jgi:CheY-like chemotaxis protein
MDLSAPRTDLSVLIVEDEPLVALLLEEMFLELGFNHTNTITNLNEAILYASNEAPSFAILDVNLRGEETYAVADILAHRSIPFVFASGARVGVNPFNAPTIQKPFSLEDLEKIVEIFFPLSRV